MINDNYCVGGYVPNTYVDIVEYCTRIKILEILNNIILYKVLMSYTID